MKTCKLLLAVCSTLLSSCVAIQLTLSVGLLFSASAAQTTSEDVAIRTLQSHSGGYLRNSKNKRVVVFVNGIFGDAVSTWKSNRGAYWPVMLMHDHEFDGVDIYIHSFNSPKIGSAQKIDELAGRMKDYLDADRVFQTHEQAIFICHSMGGLVTRAFLLKARPSPTKIPMIYFYATPTAGANVTEIARHLSANPQLEDMLPLKADGYIGDLQNQWLATSDDKKLNYPSTIASFCAYEKYDTYGVRLVERQSATNLCNRETRGILANHIDIVKPEDDRAESYVFFKAAYGRTFGLASALVNATLEWQGTYGTGYSFGPTEIALPGEKLVFQQVSAGKDIKVGCEETMTGELRAHFDDMVPEDKVLQVVPVVETSSEITFSSVALVNYDQKGATIRYSIRGADANAPCPRGQAHIVANVVVSRVNQ